MEMDAKIMNPRKISSKAKQVAETLLRLKAIQINVKEPFTWVSGIKSPVYCDNRVVNSDVTARKQMVDAFVELIRAEFPDVEIIAGIATGGMPLGALIADRLNLPFIYVRQEKKEHGLMKQVEGTFRPGQKIVLIEDHVSTGKSSIKAFEGVKEVNLEILGLISLMTYGFTKAYHLFSENQINNFSICDLDEVLDVAREQGSISEDERQFVLDFKKSQN